ncbi:MAG: MlaD family protein [Desulfocapsaceae bacterium]|nr:MlaD family protein [Desulfocapsaceae bacterium]
MESRINYTIVGIFVVLLLAGLIVFVYWLGKYGYKQEHDYYYVYMEESVSGLSSEASVKYRGVDVGIVEKMRLNPENSEEVELLLKLRHGTQIKEDTRATLKSFGITGLAFVELTGGRKDAPLLKREGKIPVIPAAPSTHARLDESLTHLAEKLDRALDKIDRLLSEQNLQNVAGILSEMKVLPQDLRSQLHGFKLLVDNSIVMEKGVTQAFDKVESAALGVEKMVRNMEHDYADPNQNMTTLVRQNLESFHQLLYELNVLVGDMQRTTRAIEANPSDLLFKRSRLQPGPGEEGYDEK